MPTNDPNKQREPAPKKSGENAGDQPRPTKEPIAPKKKGEVPSDNAEPIEREPGLAEKE
jgi:hypothetical protein